jgi:hypothetical protein
MSFGGLYNARTAIDTDFVDLIKNRHVDDYITDFVDNFTNLYFVSMFS